MSMKEIRKRHPGWLELTVTWISTLYQGGEQKSISELQNTTENLVADQLQQQKITVLSTRNRKLELQRVQSHQH